jgi:hypothetical protein
MNNLADQITIEEITLLNSRNEIHVRGTQHRGYLNFASSWYISSHELNRLLNQLQKVNPSKEIGALFENNYSSEGLIMCLTAQDLDNSTIEMNWMDVTVPILEIRA